MKTFKPSGDSWNRLERIAFYAMQVGDTQTADSAQKEFERECIGEDDCLVDDYSE